MALPKKLERKGYGMAQDIPDIFRAAAMDDVNALDVAMPHFGVNARDADLMTPLHHAAANASMRAIDRLLAEPGVDATLVDRFDRTASLTALEVLGEQGVPVAERLAPHCYPNVYREGEDVLGKQPYTPK